MEEQYPKSALDKFRQWHFWWLVVFSLFLIVTFVYYLPTRFLNQQTLNHHEDMEEHHEEMMGHEEDVSSSDEHEHGTSVSENNEHESSDDHMMDMMDDQDMMMSQDHGNDHGDDHGANAYQYHEENEVKSGLLVNLNISPVPYSVNNPLRMNFFVNIKPNNISVPTSDLEVEHEKLMHVIGVRSDMNEFFHIHPQAIGDGLLSVDHVFKKPGMYKIWSEIKKDGVVHIYGHPELNVQGSGPKDEKKVFFDESVVAGKSNYQVSLIKPGTLRQNQESSLVVDIHTLNGQEVTVENYLGAQMHLVFIKEDLSQIIHAHPTPQGGGDGHTDHDHGSTSSSADEVINFNTNFTTPGLYKAFAQFRPEGINLPQDQALLAEFWLQVEEGKAFAISPWWGLLLVSAILIIILSFMVNKYITVKGSE